MASSGAADRNESTPSMRDWVAVFGAILGAFMAVLDIQITNASLKDIQGGLAASLDEGTWISTAYLVAEIVTIPLSAWFTDVFSTRNYLIVNCILFLGFSVLCGLSDSLTMMILCRAGQGFTGGVFIPTAMTIVLRCLPLSKRSIGLALFGITATTAPAIGPTIGGWLTDTYSWHWIFYINLIPGAVLIWAVAYGVRREKMHLERLRQGDWLGIACMAIGLGSLITVLEEGERKDWFGSPMIRDLAIVAAIFIPAFIVTELLHKHPFINLRLWKQPSFASSSLMGFGMGLGLYGTVYLLPVYLAQIQGYDALQIGEVVMWLGLPQLAIFPLVPLVMRYVDSRVIVGFGLALFAVSCFMNAYLTHDWAIQQLRWSQLVRAAGQPFIITPAIGAGRRFAAGARAGGGLGDLQHHAQPRRVVRHRHAVDLRHDARAFPLLGHRRPADPEQPPHGRTGRRIEPRAGGQRGGRRRRCGAHAGPGPGRQPGPHRGLCDGLFGLLLHHRHRARDLCAAAVLRAQAARSRTRLHTAQTAPRTGPAPGLTAGEPDQFGTQAAALISPNSRAILRQDAPASSVTYTSPNRLNATMRSASAGCVARPHIVALGWVGSGRISQLSPEIGGAEHVPLFARRGLATPGEQHAGIVGLDRDAAGIGQRPFLPDLQGLPGVAEIVADKHFARRAGIEALGLRRRDRHGVNVRVIQTRLEVRPGVPAVHAAEDAVDFHPGPDDTMIVGVDDEAGHEGYADRAFRGDVDGQFLPLPSPVPRAIDPGRARAGEENIGIDRVDGQRPDRRQGPIGADALPPRPAIVAHEQARIAAGENGMRLRRDGRPAPVCGC